MVHFTLFLQRCEKREFYYVTTTDDPVLQNLANEHKGNVFATDAILAHLMASPRTIYPWDIVVQKVCVICLAVWHWFWLRAP